MKFSSLAYLLIGVLLLVSCGAPQTEKKTPVDYVNPNMGGIGQLLSSTSPNVIMPYGIMLFAKRYRGVSVKNLSFNLVNEAPGVREGYMSAEDYRRVMTRATEAIRKNTPDRIIIIDGLSVGNKVVENMISTGVAPSGYLTRAALTLSWKTGMGTNWTGVC